VLILGMVGLAAGVWAGAWSVVRANSRAAREWHRVTGTVTSVANSLGPIVQVEQGIEFTAPIVQAEGPSPYRPDERILEMESNEGLRRFRLVEFLVDPVTKRARVAGGVSFSPFLLVLLGLVYLVLAVAFFLVTLTSVTFQGTTLPATVPGEWIYYQTPPWHEPAVVSARFGAWPALRLGLGAAICVFGLVMLWTSDRSGLATRVGVGSMALFAAGVVSVYALDRATYRIEADSTGLRESSAAGWKMTPWGALCGAVEETAYYSAQRSRRSIPMLDHVTRRVYFTDDQRQEVVSIDDRLVPAQGKALLAHVLSRTGLQPEKRERQQLQLNYRQ